MSPSSYAWTQLRLKVQQQKASRAFRLLRASGIEPLLIKGFAAARLYPPDILRESVDIDFAVAAGDYDAASELLGSPDFDGLAVDLHRELRHLDTVPWRELFGRSQLISTEYGDIRVLAPEDHLRVLCVHWLNDGGIDKNRLWDIYYGVANREPGFDWSLFLDSVSARRRRWLTCTIGLAHRYLGLPLDDLPIAEEAKSLPDWLTRSVESSWSDPRDEVPIWLTLRQPKLLLRQIALRFYINPVRATAELEGDFEGDFRFGYQFRNYFQRLGPSIRRNVRALSK